MPDFIEDMTEEEDERFAQYQEKKNKEREEMRNIRRNKADESITISEEEDDAFSRWEEAQEGNKLDQIRQKALKK